MATDNDHVVLWQPADDWPVFEDGMRDHKVYFPVYYDDSCIYI